MKEEFHWYDCGEIGGGWPHSASAHQSKKDVLNTTTFPTRMMLFLGKIKWKRDYEK